MPYTERVGSSKDLLIWGKDLQRSAQSHEGSNHPTGCKFEKKAARYIAVRLPKLHLATFVLHDSNSLHWEWHDARQELFIMCKGRYLWGVLSIVLIITFEYLFQWGNCFLSGRKKRKDDYGTYFSKTGKGPLCHLSFT